MSLGRGRSMGWGSGTRAMNRGDNSQYISTLQAADALGVSVSTIKRWVDEDILPAYRTAGGHRKLLRAEVLALARQGELPYRDLTGLSVASSGDQPLDLQAISAALLAAVLRGDGTEVSALIRRAYHSGASIETLADQVIAPVMGRVGHDWEAGRIDVWQEHRGTQLCAAALYDLKDELEARAERKRPVAVGGAPEGDPYLLATLLAQIVLLDAGWATVNLGPNTPLESLTRAIRQLRPRLVWLSVSYLKNTVEFLRSYREFYQAAERIGVAVAVGGQALVEPVRSAMPYTTHGDALNHLAAFARTLHPRPKRPSRGRPPKQ
jgi:MerR family transcriptional regulator, light-induced transcriptional regulator